MNSQSTKECSTVSQTETSAFVKAYLNGYVRISDEIEQNYNQDKDFGTTVSFSICPYGGELSCRCIACCKIRVDKQKVTLSKK